MFSNVTHSNHGSSPTWRTTTRVDLFRCISPDMCAPRVIHGDGLIHPSCGRPESQTWALCYVASRCIVLTCGGQHGEHCFSEEKNHSGADEVVYTVERALGLHHIRRGVHSQPVTHRDTFSSYTHKQIYELAGWLNCSLVGWLAG